MQLPLGVVFHAPAFKGHQIALQLDPAGFVIAKVGKSHSERLLSRQWETAVTDTKPIRFIAVRRASRALNARHFYLLFTKMPQSEISLKSE